MNEKNKNALSGALLIAVFIATKLLNLESSFFIHFITLCGILFHSYLLGTRLFPRAGWCAGTMIGVVLFAALHSTSQTIWFYLGDPLNAISDIWITTTTMVACHLFTFWIAEHPKEEKRETNEPWTLPRAVSAIILLCISSAALTGVMIGAFNAGTTDSIRAPWTLLPIWTLHAIALSWTVTLLSIWLVRSRGLTTLLSGASLAITTVIAPLLYRLGYGFDGFLHIAGEKQILATGTLNPKPLYYIGQYVYTTFLSRAARIPIEHVDRWLVPIAAAILLPLVMYIAHTNKKPLTAHYSLFTLSLIPLAPFIATTPQSFAYLLGIAAVILAHSDMPSTSVATFIAPIILVTWSIAVHPLAGIPLFFIVVAMLLAKRFRTTPSSRRLMPILLPWIFVLLSAAAIPVLFAILSVRGGTRITWNLPAIATIGPWRDLLQSFTPWIGNRYALWPAWASLVAQSLPVIGFLGSCGTMMIKRRTSDALLLGSGILLFISGTILKSAGEFAFLIDYERGNYAERLATLATLLLVVGSMPFWAWLLDRARSDARALLIPLVIGFLAIATAHSTNALPRHDALVTGHGWSVGESDREAVRAIDRDANSRTYTVLANQSVSAAAVSQFGFKRYNGDVFFYPIPTGGPLYQLYLDMTYTKPSRNIARDAGTLGGSNLVYVVLNDYWWKADEIAESLTEIADATWVIGEPEKGPGTSVRVYRFELHK
ncbi:MAG: hypothetical protein AAB879_02285 [Patescibacteria group bacterium]